MPDVKINLIINGKQTESVIKLTEQQVKKLGLEADVVGQQMGAAFARGAGVAEDAMQDAVKAISQLQAGTLQSIRQVDEAIAHLEQARAQATTEAGRGLFGGMIDQAKVVRKGFVDVSDAADGMAAAQQRARIAGQTLGYTLNDSQQFAFGFHQGVIAISNNLPMLVDQISDVARESGSARSAMRALAGAMSGPAGILTLVSLGVVAWGAYSSAQERGRKETDKKTEALRKQEQQIRDNIEALREMSGAALGGQLRTIEAQLAAKQRQLGELQRQQLELGGRNDAEVISRFDPVSQEMQFTTVREERLRLSGAILTTDREIAQLTYQKGEAEKEVNKDLDAQIAAKRAEIELKIRDNTLSKEQREADLRGLREELAVLERQRELRAGPSSKQLRDQERAAAEADERRLERMKLEAEQITEKETTEAGALRRTIDLIRHRFEVERREMRERFAGDQQYAAFLEEQIERLGRLERAAIAAATAPKMTEQARPEAALAPVEIDVPDAVDVVETLGVIDMRIKALRDQYREAGTQAERDFIRKQIEGLEKVRDAMEGGRTALMDWQDAFDMIQEGFRMIVDAAMWAEDARMAAIERRHAAEMAALDEEISAEANRGKVLTEEEARREALLQKRRALEEKHEEEMRRERQRMAEAEKKRALFEVAINTAVAVSKVWGQTGIFGVAAQWPVLAMGAAQMALVASQPVPKFAKGVDGFGGGMAIVGEEGPELVTLGSGSNVLTNRNTEFLMSMLSSAARVTPAPSASGITEASMERAFSKALAKTELRASGRSLALVQAREEALVRKAGLR